MTQSSLQTQCPKCETRFRVTDEQLGIAKGKVRCGNCMAVFNAIDHQVLPRTSQPQTPPKPASAAPEPGAGSSASSGSFASEEDFVFADNPEEDAAEGPYAGSKMTFSDDELSDSFRSVDGQRHSDFHDTDDDSPHHDVDESWAEAILEDTDQPSSAPGKAEAPRKAEMPRRPEPRPEPTPRPASQPSPRSPEPSPEPGLELEMTPDVETEPVRAMTASKPGDDFSDTFAASEPDFGSDSRNERLGEPMAATIPFDDLRREPVSVRGGGTGKLRTFVWTLVVLALIGVLVAQVTWFQFDRLSAIPELRPFYERGCEFAGCELEPLINVDAIQSRKLVVRTDPENRTQLVVDAVIINRAAFEQPFPAIALTFSNLNGDVVAQSIFTPDEYLAGDGQNLDMMPKDTPVRIAIDIRDPGKDAVNYNLNFRPYTP
ncbi:DUF3426 domain-containing protein [Marinobacter arenosus]|uniref:DUF3426 domain-containing protein n=1 Tax=Marinobacter arenosus TaxID=2856822 RepID=UPI001C4C36CD|nr:DUF3426 domain-containing protein [Marinobacter arenosus]MBW0147615.1 DUF3426 domain-containing protein [Marinobacter arenosus]